MADARTPDEAEATLAVLRLLGALPSSVRAELANAVHLGEKRGDPDQGQAEAQTILDEYHARDTRSPCPARHPRSG